MKAFNFKSILFLLVLVVGVGGCRKFLDVNDNPNLPKDATVDLLLPYSQAAIGHALGNTLQIYGGIWAQHWTQNPFSSQYRGIDQYSISTTSFDRLWRMLYADALEDLQVILTKSNEQPESNQYAAIANILKAYAFQLTTDAFGDVPLSEALNPDVTSPPYNPQEQVYDSILAYIDLGASQIDAESTSKPAADDLLFGGDMNQWKRFANTLKLRALIRLSEVSPDKAASGIAQLNGAEFLENDAAISYSTTGGSQ